MPTKAEQKLVDAAVSGFNAQYASPDNWGPARWTDSLLPALERPTRHAALVNQFSPASTWSTLVKDEVDNGTVHPLSTLPDVCVPRPDNKIVPLVAYIKSDGTQFRQPVLGPPAPAQRLMSHWNLDAASILCAHMLAVQPGDRVLDLCAAPGGKSLALAQLLFPALHALQARQQSRQSAHGSLHVNELDKARNKRLTANLQAYLPAILFTTQQTVQVLNLDASDPRSHTRLPLGAGGYDKVLLDAPCSSERHLIHSHQRALSCGRVAADSELARWRRAHSRALAKTQAALLMTALKAVRAGGRVVYSTCSIERGENDGVVDKVRELVAKERRKGTIDWDFDCLLGRNASPSTHNSAALDDWAEETSYGRIVLPDHPSGGQWGPLYFCVITKTASKT